MSMGDYRGMACSCPIVGAPQFYFETPERKPYRTRMKCKNPHPKPRFKKGGGKQHHRRAVTIRV